MSRSDIKEKISAFRADVQKLRDLLLSSRNSMARIVKNHEAIDELRTQLNTCYGRLEKYITRLGNRPRMSDGVHRQSYPVYSNAFSSDVLQRSGPSLDAVLQDLDYILGKLDSLSDNESKDIFGDENEDDYFDMMYARMERDIDLAQKGLLKSSRLKDTEDYVQGKIKKSMESFPEEVRLTIEKMTSGWTSMLPPGFIDEQIAKQRLGPWMQLIEEIRGEQPRTEGYLGSGQQYDARKLLRAIFESAHREIIIVDNFLHPHILQLVEPYITTNECLRIKCLMRKKNNSNFSSFRSDLGAFMKQYPSAVIEAKENDLFHGRFIIVDESEVFQSGHSLLGLGSKADRISKVEGDDIQKIITDVAKAWESGEAMI